MNLSNMSPDKTSNNHTIPLINGLSEVAYNYDAFIIDIWGVVHDGAELYPETEKTLRNLQAQNKKILFLSNACFLSEEIERSLGAMGLNKNIFKNSILTAGESARLSVMNLKGKCCYDMSTSNYQSIRAGAELSLTNDVERADFILNVVGKGHLDNESEFYQAMEKGLKYNIPMICGNPDAEVSISGEKYRCAGYYADWYEERGGQVEWHGKPYLPIYEWAWEKLGKIDKSKICAIGDSLRTDITGAKTFGIDALWNLDGTTRDLSLEEANQRARDENLSPSGILRGFHWD